jgi:hypothetical protein
MPKKLIFNMIRANDVREAVQYYPIVFLRGSRSWTPPKTQNPKP